MKRLGQWFAQFSTLAGVATGHPMAFTLSVLAVVVWGAFGPWFGFSDTWQLVINTSTTIITYLLVFLIQSTQNRDNAAVHLKLDEIIRALPQARTDLVRHHIETASDEEIAALKAELDRMAGA